MLTQSRWQVVLLQGLTQHQRSLLEAKLYQDLIQGARPVITKTFVNILLKLKMKLKYWEIIDVIDKTEKKFRKEQQQINWKKKTTKY